MSEETKPLVVFSCPKFNDRIDADGCLKRQEVFRGVGDAECRDCVHREDTEN